MPFYPVGPNESLKAAYNVFPYKKNQGSIYSAASELFRNTIKNVTHDNLPNDTSRYDIDFMEVEIDWNNMSFNFIEELSTVSINVTPHSVIVSWVENGSTLTMTKAYK